MNRLSIIILCACLSYLMAQPEFVSHKIVKMEAFDFDLTDDYRILIYIDSTYADTAYSFYEKLYWYEYYEQNNQWGLFHAGMAVLHHSWNQYMNFVSDVEISRHNSDDVLTIHHYWWGPEGIARDLVRNGTYLRSAGVGGHPGVRENMVKFDPVSDSTIYLSAFDYHMPDHGFVRSTDNGDTWYRIWDTLSSTSWVPWRGADIKISPFNNNNITLTGGLDREGVDYSFISTSDYGQTWYENPYALFNVYDFEYVSEDTVIFHTDRGRYICSQGGAEPTFYDSLISNAIHYDVVDNQFYFNIGKCLVLSDTKGLTYSVLIDSVDSIIIDVYGVKGSDTVYVATQSTVYLFDGTSLDTIFHLPEIILAVHRSERLPEAHLLNQNIPNPFNSTTRITYTSTNSGNTRLEIIDLLGRRIATLVDKFQSPGNFTVSWDGRDQSGVPAPTGVYIYRLSMNDVVEVRKMILVR